MTRSIFNYLLICLLLLVPVRSMAFDSFVVEDIRVEGVQRISLGTVFNYLPVKVGDVMTESLSARSISKLYETGFFSDIALARDGDVLIVTVGERPSIASITIEGNNEIETEELLDGLKSIGLAEGRIFDRAVLDKIQLDLQRQYFARGFYGTVIETEITDADKNRVNVALTVKEGEVAEIRQITILGNTQFDTDELLDEFELGIPAWYSFFSSKDQYSKQKLSADLESLRSFYLNRGYINFDIRSTQVSISPDRSSVHIVINVSEGDQFTIEDVQLAGDLIVDEAELRALIETKPGDIFSRRMITEDENALTDRLGEEGYAFANVNPVPEVDTENKRVSMTFFVDPGKRVYVRRINISGNERTKDEVIRRELRQMEGGWLSSKQMNRSRVRIQRLSYIGEVNIETLPVAGSQDLVDIDLSVTERPSGSFMAGLGYSGGAGVSLNFSVSMENFLGTGKRVSAEVSNSDVSRVYSFSHTDPYHTIDGVSQSVRAFFRETDTREASVAEYTTDVFGGSLGYGIPLSEYDRVRLGIEFEHMAIETTSFTPLSYVSFLNTHGDEFDFYKLTMGWSHDTRNRTVFADSGFLQTINGELVVPGSDIEYYKVTSRSNWLSPITKRLTFSADANIGLGDGLGDLTQLPFFDKFYAGGVHSVRGYRSNSLGPRERGDVIGGDFRTVGSLEVLFPPPFAADSQTVRLSTFFDIGNVYAEAGDFESDELRQSAGIGLVWLSPMAPLSFSISNAINAVEGDDTETFQFTLGASF